MLHEQYQEFLYEYKIGILFLPFWEQNNPENKYEMLYYCSILLIYN